MSAPKLYLIRFLSDSIETIVTYRELDRVKQELVGKIDGEVTYLLHCGFLRPVFCEKTELSETLKGKVLYSGALKWALPEDYKSTDQPAAYITVNKSEVPFFLASNQWGYYLDSNFMDEVAENIITSISVPHLTESPTGWVKSFTEQNTDINQIFQKCGIHDDNSYVLNRDKLPTSIGLKLDRERFDSLKSTIDQNDPYQLLQIAPRLLMYQHINELRLPVRARNVLLFQNINQVHELAELSVNQLLRLPNLGKRSIQDICQAIADRIENTLFLPNTEATNKEDAYTTFRLPAWPHPTTGTINKEDAYTDIDTSLIVDEIPNVPLIEHLSRELNKLREVDRSIIRDRMGISGFPLTLEELGEKHGVTRERVRQREKKAMSFIIREEFWGNEIGKRIGQLLSNRKAPLVLELLDVEDDWFKGFDDQYVYLRNIIQEFSRKEIRVIKANGRNVVTRISQDKWDALLGELRVKLKQIAVDKSWNRSDTGQYFSTCLSEHRAQELTPVLHEIFDEYLQYEDESLSAVLVSYGKSAKSTVATVLAQAESPLHFTEIAKRASELLDKEVDERRVQGAVSQKGIWQFDRGTYGLIKHCPLSESERLSIRLAVENIFYQGPINKQWHSTEIIELLAEKPQNLLARLDPYVLKMSIMESRKILYLGRMVWARSDSGMETGDRIQTRESFIQILESAGKPLTGQELKQRLLEIRGINKHMQIHEDERLVAIGPNIWGLSEWY